MTRTEFESTILLAPSAQNQMTRFKIPAAKNHTQLLSTTFFSRSPSRKSFLLPLPVADRTEIRTTTAIMATTQGAISKRRKFVADGVFYAELNEFFQRELAEEGYSGVEVRVTPTVTDISMLYSPPLLLLIPH
jgi:hypothetical protein